MYMEKSGTTKKNIYVYTLTLIFSKYNGVYISLHFLLLNFKFFCDI